MKWFCLTQLFKPLAKSRVLMRWSTKLLNSHMREITYPFHRKHNRCRASIRSCIGHRRDCRWRSDRGHKSQQFWLGLFLAITSTGLGTLLSWTVSLRCIFGTTSGSPKQIPPVACLEVVDAGFSTARVGVRGGFISDTGEGVKLPEITEGKEASDWNSSTLGEYVMPSLLLFFQKSLYFGFFCLIFCGHNLSFSL